MVKRTPSSSDDTVRRLKIKLDKYKRKYKRLRAHTHIKEPLPPVIKIENACSPNARRRKFDSLEKCLRQFEFSPLELNRIYHALGMALKTPELMGRRGKTINAVVIRVAIPSLPISDIVNKCGVSHNTLNAVSKILYKNVTF